MKLKTIKEAACLIKPYHGRRGLIRDDVAALLHIVSKKQLKEIHKSGTPEEIEIADCYYRQNQTCLDSIIQILQFELILYRALPIAKNLRHNGLVDYLAMFPYYKHLNVYDLTLLKKHKSALSRKKYIKKWGPIMDCECLIEMYQPMTKENQEIVAKLKCFKADSESEFVGQCPVFVAVERLKNKFIKEKPKGNGPI